MNIFVMMLQGFVLGISTGVYCVCGCIPALLPFIVAEGKSMKHSFNMVMQYLAGRLVAYTLLGTLTLILGRQIASHSVGRVIVAIALVTLAAILMAHGLRVNFPQLCICNLKLHTRILGVLSKASLSIPFLAGFAIGTNACPPILLALTYALTTEHILTSVAFLTLFFVGTAFFALPISLAWLAGKVPSLRGVAEAALLLSAIWFASQGIATIFWR
ncbi:MAG: sulfite exporter TauE/SafE family protein [Armatimonadota bacterium]|nr:sulfite exporter TauE/SafE family protein [Armatimonadota bacterium]MCX7778114.1 sulfite exporter TauE/SafE family protein [Armatimonadota bacterium]MDW8026175.1 sulfite exporter TauE/SafE family protein [Armatimonadota bacterium]